jgi:uncharacterized membrane protein (UPF0136 family)
MKDKISFRTTLTFAICLIVFGFFGFYKTGSQMSLYSSLTFGLLLIGTCVGMKKGQKWSVYAAPILAAVLTVMFAIRMILTHKPVPTILTIASFSLFFFLFYRAIPAVNSSKKF